jgi:hypothetical protein
MTLTASQENNLSLRLAARVTTAQSGTFSVTEGQYSSSDDSFSRK